MNNQYKLYTDASRRKDIDGNPMCIIAGVLLDPKNKPILEFSSVVDNLDSSDQLEMIAFQEGFLLAKEVVNENLVCYLDSLNSVNRINRNMNDFINCNSIDKIEVKHLSRKLNTYANALAKLPFNIQYFGSVKTAYHNLNRSKQRFYNRLKEL